MAPQANASAELPEHDFNLLLHELRTREIRRMPAGGRRFLSAGCAGRWYFDWIDDNYPTKLDVHHGVEAYSPCPPDLPPHARWVKNTIGQMQDIPSTSVDLVFAGQTVEHVWPPDLAAFLLEAHRVLAPGGHVVADSPNRTLTHAMRWVQPQHTAELTTEEMVELLGLAGFDDVHVRGIWLCYDRQAHRVLPMLPEPTDRTWTAARRAELAKDNPEDSFIWWAEARKGSRRPNVDALHRRAAEIYDTVTAHTFGRVSHLVGKQTGYGPDRVVEAAAGEAGLLLYGPEIPLHPGGYRARFELKRGDGPVAGDGAVAVVEVFDGCENKPIAVRPLTAEQLPAGQWRAVEVPLDLADAHFGVQVRVHTTGACSLAVRLAVDVRARHDAAVPAVTLGQPTESEQRIATALCQQLAKAGFIGMSGKPLRYRIADRVNDALKKVSPVQRLVRRMVG